MTNAVLNRIKYLLNNSSDEFSYEVFCISYYDGLISRLLRESNKRKGDSILSIDGITINVIWWKFSVLDYILKYKLHLKPIFSKYEVSRICKLFSNYNLISAHSFVSGEIAREIHKKYNVPFCMSWHGSDIHAMPFDSKYMFKTVKYLIENAKYNFFVSFALRSQSDKITTKGNKQVLYNGYNPEFKMFSCENRKLLRTKYDVDSNTTVVGFVGNLIDVKNALLLPEIFKEIKKLYPYNLKFWIIGDGILKNKMISKSENYGMSAEVRFWGNMPYSKMPDLMNCIDLLIMPSKNEGLPLVTVEAIKCGAKVIGSNVGGIAESIGEDNVVKLGDDFIARFSKKCVDALNGDYKVYVNSDLDWSKTAIKEIQAYQSIVGE